MSRLAPALALAALLGACIGMSAPVVTPTVTLRLSLPVDLPPAAVARLIVNVRGVGGDPPALAVATLGATVRTLAADGGPREIEIRVEPNPFLTAAANLLLTPAPGSPGPSAAFTVEATAYGRDGVARARGAAQTDARNQPIRFGFGDAFVDVAMVCLLSAGCAPPPPDGGVDGGAPDAGPPDAGPTPITVAGQVRNLLGAPLAGAGVLLGTTAQTADGQGRFSFPAITPPYDLTVTSALGNATVAASWLQVAAENPGPVVATVPAPDGGIAFRQATLTLNWFLFNDENAEIILTSRALYLPLNGLGVLFPRQRRKVITTSGSQSVTFTATEITWIGPPSIEVIVAGAAFTPATGPDGGATGAPPTYGRIAVAKIAITDGVTTTFSLGNHQTFVAGNRQVAVNATGAPSFDRRRYFPLIDVDGTQVAFPGSPVAGNDLPSVTFVDGEALARVCATCSFFVAAVARDRDQSCAGPLRENAGAVGYSAPIPAGAVSAAVTLLDPPVLSRPEVLPADGGTTFDGGAPTAAPLAYAFSGPAGYAAHAIMIVGQQGDAAHTVVTAGQSGTFPDVRALGVGFPAGTYLLLLLSQTAVGPSAALAGGPQALIWPSNLCGFEVPLGYSPGNAIGLNLRFVELKP